MAIDVVWRPQAREDLLAIYVFIASENPRAAERLADRIEAKLAVLSTQPRIGTRRPDIRPSVRVLIEVPYLIIYETHPDTDQGPIDTVEVVRIVHGRRDLRGLG